ncbi:MAG: Mur ligase family protein [Anaeroplasma sp.]
MLLSKLYPKYKNEIIIRGITNKANETKKNYIYVSNNNDTITTIRKVIENGACVIVSEKKITADNHVIVIRVRNINKELNRLLKIFYHYSPTINTIGISSNESSTIICLYLEKIFSQLGNVGLIYNNSINYLNYHFIIEGNDNSQLYKILQHMNYSKISDCIIDTKNENSLPYLNCIIASKMETFDRNNRNYYKSKINLIKKLDKNSLLIYNQDEKNVKDLYLFNKGYSISYGIKKGDYHIDDFILNLNGSIFNVYHHNRLLGSFKTNLFGKENIYNALAAIAYANELGIPINIISNGIKSLDNNIKIIDNNGITQIICNCKDSNSLSSLLNDLKTIKNDKIILVIGAFDGHCQSLFGKIACELTKIVIFTDHNSFSNLLYDFTKKINHTFDYYLSIDEKKALELALKLAKNGDYIVLINIKIENLYS